MNEMENRQNLVISIVIMILISVVSLHAGTSLDAEIMKIKSASPKERVRLMNNLKRRLFTLNRVERIRAIRKLRKSIAHSSKTRSRLSYRSRIKNRREKIIHKISNRSNRDISGIRDRIEIVNHYDVTNVVHDTGGVVTQIYHNRHKTIKHNRVTQNSNSYTTINPGGIENQNKDVVGEDKTTTGIDVSNNVANSEVTTNSSNPLDHLKTPVKNIDSGIDDNIVFKTTKTVRNPNNYDSSYNKPIQTVKEVFKTGKVLYDNYNTSMKKTINPIRNQKEIFHTGQAVVNPKMDISIKGDGLNIQQNSSIHNENIESHSNINSNYNTHSDDEHRESSTSIGGRW